MIPLGDIKINDLDGNPTPNEPNTTKKVKLISKKAYLCQSASQIQRNSHRKVFRIYKEGESGVIAALIGSRDASKVLTRRECETLEVGAF
jgi:hypothetical protein